MTATYLPSRNGVATSTALFARGLRALGHEVRLFAPHHPRARAEEGVYRLPSTLLGAPPDYPLLLPLAGRAASGLPLRDLDVLHTMHPFVAGQTALAWARGLDIPLVFTAHTQYHQYVHYARMPHQVSRSLVRRHVRAFARAADAVLVPGAAMAGALRAYGYMGEVRQLPNPVDLTSFAGLDCAAARARLGLPPQAPVLVYLGRLAEEKNLGVLLTAYQQARAAHPDLHLLLVGDGPQRSALERRFGGDQVHFAGAVEYARVPAMLAAADAFVTASVSEVLPMSMLEALAAGLPLVAAHSPAAHDLIEPGVNGLVCDASAGALAGGIAGVLQPGSADAWRAGALASAAQHGVERVAAQLAGVYAGLLSARAPLPQLQRKIA